MKPIKLVIKGLNSFIEEQTVDFEKLTDRGLFGIFGPTGSGKSTILDGITLALYGDIARKSSNFINTNCNDLNVSFTFQISGSVNHIYIVNRQFRRDKKTGNAKTHAASVREVTAEGEEVLADSATSVNKTCREILGLSLEDFTRTVVLPQGKFSEFLKLEGKQRREMLERLFNLQDYGERLAQKLSRQMNAEREKTNQLIGELNTYEEVSEDRLTEQQSLLQAVTKDLEDTKEKQKEIENRFKQGEEIWNLQRELNAYQEQEQILKNQANRMQQEEEKLRRGESALKVNPFMVACEKRQREIAHNKQEEIVLEEKLKDLTIKKQEAEVVFRELSIEKDENLPEIRLRSQQLKDLVEDNIKLKALEDVISQTELGLKKLQENIDKFSTQEIDSSRQIREISEAIERAQKEEQNLRIDQVIRSKMEEGLKLSQSYEFEQKNYTKSMTHVQELEKAKEGYEIEWNKLNEALTKANGSLEEMIKLQEVHLKQIPISQEVLLMKQEQLTLAKEKWQRYKGLNQELEGYLLLDKAHEEDYNKLEIKFDKQKVVVEELKKQIEKVKLEYLAHTFRGHLNVGEPCPVCGSLEHPIQGRLEEEYVENTKINALEEQLKAEEATFEKVQKDLNQIQAQLTANKVSVERLQKEKMPLEALFKDRNIEVEEEEFVALSEALKVFEEKKQEFESSINRLKEEQGKLESEVRQKQTILEENQKQRIQYDTEINKQSLVLKEIEQQLDALKKEVNTQDFNVMSQEIRRKDNRREEILNDVKTQNEQKEVLIKNREGLQEKLNKYKASFERGLAQFDEQQKSKQDILLRMSVRLKDILSLKENKNPELKAEIEEILVFLRNESLLKAQLKGEVQYESVLAMEQYGRAQEDTDDSKVLSIEILQTWYEQYPLLGKCLDELHMKLESLMHVMDKTMQQIENLFTQAEANKEAIEKQYESVSKLLLEIKTTLQGLEKQLQDDLWDLERSLREENLTEEEVKLYLRTKEELDELRKNIEQYKEDCSKLTGAIEAIQGKLGDRRLEADEWHKLQEEKQQILDEVADLTKQQINLTTLVKSIQEALAKLGKLREEKQKLDHKMAILTDLDKLFKGKRFVEFVAATRLKYVSLEASKKLKEITNGNYGLEVDEDSKFIIRDYKNGGAERDASTLSGGETFLASLALALALSAEIQLKGTAPLELFFLDEGFGTLDDDLLEVVMGSLEKIHNDKLKVGIISHVEAIKNRVPVKLLLTPAEAGMGGTKVRLERS